jgi:hypothetical protein
MRSRARGSLEVRSLIEDNEPHRFFRARYIVPAGINLPGWPSEDLHAPMNTSRTASLRGFGKAVIAALLIVLLFLSALAASNSTLHGVIHPDHQSPSHYCLVSMFEQGHGDTPDAMVFVQIPDPICVASHVADAQVVPSPDRWLHSGRGPPCLS